MNLSTPAFAAAALVALLHMLFMIVESLLWTQPAVRKRFGLSAEEAETTKILAFNQGAYNGCLAAALAYGLWAGEPLLVAVLLVFVIVVGLVGAATAKLSILFLQALPAAIALGLMFL